MTPAQLSEIAARLRKVNHWPWLIDGKVVSMVPVAPADIAALIAEVKRLRDALKQACTCATCNGAGEIDFVTGYKDNGPNDPIEVYELDECPECDGSKIGSHVEEATARVLEDCQ